MIRNNKKENLQWILRKDLKCGKNILINYY